MFLRTNGMSRTMSRGGPGFFRFLVGKLSMLSPRVHLCCICILLTRSFALGSLKRRCDFLIISAGFPRSSSTYQHVISSTAFEEHFSQNLEYWKLKEHIGKKLWTYDTDIVVDKPIGVVKTHEYRPELLKLCNETLVLISYHDDINSYMNSICAAGWSKKMENMVVEYISSYKELIWWSNSVESNNILYQSKHELQFEKKNASEKIFDFLQRHTDGKYISLSNLVYSDKEANKYIPGGKACPVQEEAKQASLYANQIRESFNFKRYLSADFGIMFFFYDQPRSIEYAKELARSYISMQKAYPGIKIGIGVPMDVSICRSNSGHAYVGDEKSAKMTHCHLSLMTQKINMAMDSPFNVTLMIDTDVTVSSILKNGLKKHIMKLFDMGIQMVFSPAAPLGVKGTETLTTYYQINGGLLAYVKTNAVRLFFDMVKRYIFKYKIHEQGAINRLIREGAHVRLGMHIYMLPPNWNCRFVKPGATLSHHFDNNTTEDVECIFVHSRL